MYRDQLDIVLDKFYIRKEKEHARILLPVFIVVMTSVIVPRAQQLRQFIWVDTEFFIRILFFVQKFQCFNIFSVRGLKHMFHP
jgi:hypothetical protein